MELENLDFKNIESISEILEIFYHTASIFMFEVKMKGKEKFIFKFNSKQKADEKKDFILTKIKDD